MKIFFAWINGRFSVYCGLSWKREAESRKRKRCENFLQFPPSESQNSKVKIQNDLPSGDGVREFALGMEADTGPFDGFRTGRG